MLLDAYREVYFSGGVSSVYLWEEEEAADGSPSASAAGSFAGCFLILKRVGGEGEEGPVGAWESSHVVQVCEDHTAGACTCVCVCTCRQRRVPFREPSRVAVLTMPV